MERGLFPPEVEDYGGRGEGFVDLSVWYVVGIRGFLNVR